MRTGDSAANPVQAARRVKQIGREAGFQLVRIGRAEPLHNERTRYERWVEERRHGSMQWITPAWVDRCADPRDALPAARSVVCVGLSYWAGPRPRDEPGQGRVARYAWGADYHEVIGERLRSLGARLSTEFGGNHRWYVDAGPLMDKALAARSGLGWYGKNTNILTERFGSFVLLGELLTTLDLAPDAPLARDCGKCKMCLVACPTGALGPEYSIDSRRCISYLTIEHRASIPRELRPLMGRWVFGCDICQDVCPPTMQPHIRSQPERRAWVQEVRSHTGAPVPGDPAPTGRSDAATLPDLASNPLFELRFRPSVDLYWLLRLTHAQYLEAFRGTAIRRAKPWMLRRNAAVALGNTGGAESAAPLDEAMRCDEHSIVRGHAAWGLGQVAARLELQEPVVLLSRALGSELDAQVREEIQAALEPLTPH